MRRRRAESITVGDVGWTVLGVYLVVRAVVRLIAGG